MIHGLTQGLLHELVGGLLYPVIAALGIALLLTVWETGMAIAECSLTLRRLQRQSLASFEDYANRRLERVDLLARGGPVLGLMGTLIPLGPGLSALNSGNIDILATALTVAFDTTVLGLLVGLVAYILGRLRRRWYEATWQTLQGDSHD